MALTGGFPRGHGQASVAIPGLSPRKYAGEASCGRTDVAHVYLTADGNPTSIVLVVLGECEENLERIQDAHAALG